VSGVPQVEAGGIWESSQCMLVGEDVPFVLKATENPAEFTLLGDSHVHELMDRELWKLAKIGMGLDSLDGSHD
jgi:hypothetical protein